MCCFPQSFFPFSLFYPIQPSTSPLMMISLSKHLRFWSHLMTTMMMFLNDLRTRGEMVIIIIIANENKNIFPEVWTLWLHFGPVENLFLNCQKLGGREGDEKRIYKRHKEKKRRENCHQLFIIISYTLIIIAGISSWWSCDSMGIMLLVREMDVAACKWSVKFPLLSFLFSLPLLSFFSLWLLDMIRGTRVSLSHPEKSQWALEQKVRLHVIVISGREKMRRVSFSRNFNARCVW